MINIAERLQVVVVRQDTIVVNTPRFPTTLVANYLSMQQHCGQSAVRHSDGTSCKVTLAATIHMEVCTDTSNNPVFQNKPIQQLRFPVVVTQDASAHTALPSGFHSVTSFCTIPSCWSRCT